MQCPYCGQEHPDLAKYCPITGKALDLPIYCEKCGEKIQASWKVCPYCGTTLNDTVSPEEVISDTLHPNSTETKKVNQNWKRTIIAITLLIFIVVVVIYIFGGKLLNDLTREKIAGTQTSVEISPTATQYSVPTSTVTPLLTPHPLLQGINFPVEIATYPDDWPDDLHYPGEFQPVEFSSGSLDSNSSISLSAKLRYKGNVKDAVELLSSFFIKQGWHILEQTDFNTNSTYLLIGKNSEADQGILLISKDASDPTITIILSTLSQSK